MPARGGQMQRCLLLCIAGINLSALPQQPADLGRTAHSCCIVQGGGSTSPLAGSATDGVPADIWVEKMQEGWWLSILAAGCCPAAGPAAAPAATLLQVEAPPVCRTAPALFVH
jgi:hypothetical protein